MTKEDARIHERIDELVESTSRIEKGLAILTTACGDCRKIVMGNGSKPISTRVTVLEERSRFATAIVVVASSVISAVISGVIVHAVAG